MKLFLKFNLFIAVFFINKTFAQVGIGTTTPDASAALEITSTSKGLLIPRMTAYPSAPVTGLTVYRTDLNGFYTWNGSAWSQDVYGVKFYSSDGTLSSSRTVTMNANNLTFASTTGNLIYNPTGSGKMGVGTTTPLSGLDLKSSLGLPSTTTSASTYSVTATDAMVYLTSSSNQTITLPTASTVSGRIYYFINNASASKTISSYSALNGSTSTSIASNTAMALQSDGTVWRQFQNTPDNNSSVISTLFKKTTADLSHLKWIAPWNHIDISELDIVVPNGKWLIADYVLIGKTSNASWPPSNLMVRGYTSSSDYITGELFFRHSSDMDLGEEVIAFSNAYPDNDPNNSRGVDTEFPSANVPVVMMLRIRYKNNSGSSQTFGYSFGGDIQSTLDPVTISILAGSAVTYSIY